MQPAPPSQPQTVPDPRVLPHSAAPPSVNHTLATLVNVCQANQDTIRSLVEEVRTLRREVASLRSPSVIGRSPRSPQLPNNMPRPSSPVHSTMAAGPVPVALPVTSPNPRSPALERPGGVTNLSAAPWHHPPAAASRSRARRRCRFPGCSAAPHVGCGVHCCATHCTSRRCDDRGRPVSVAPPQSCPSVLAGPIGAPRAVGTCRRGGCSEPVHQECSTGHCDSHCTSRRCSFHTGALGNS